MKKIFLYIMPVLVLIASCRKDDDAAPTPAPKLPQGVSTTAISQITGTALYQVAA